MCSCSLLPVIPVGVILKPIMDMESRGNIRRLREGINCMSKEEK